MEVGHFFLIKLISLFMQRGGDPLILCFVDFTNPACAATALSALQGDHFPHFYSIYENDYCNVVVSEVFA